MRAQQTDGAAVKAGEPAEHVGVDVGIRRAEQHVEAAFVQAVDIGLKGVADVIAQIEFGEPDSTSGS